VRKCSSVCSFSACSRCSFPHARRTTARPSPDTTKAAADAATAPAAPKNLDLAKAALVAAKAKYAKHEVVDTDCAPIRSLEADFAGDKSPDAVKTTKEIDAFCEVDVKLEGEVATLKGDNDKLVAAQKKKDKPGEQNCTRRPSKTAARRSSNISRRSRRATSIASRRWRRSKPTPTRSARRRRPREVVSRVAHTLAGSVDGTTVTVEFVSDDVHDLTLRGTEVNVPYTPGTTKIRLNVRWGQGHFARDLREGLYQDIVLGDPAFDEQYLVDAAPEDVVRELLDAPTRALLLAGAYRIWSRKDTLLVERSEWTEDLGALAEHVALAIDLVRRLEPAERAAREKQQREGLGTYRTLKTDAEVDAERVADLEAMNARENTTCGRASRAKRALPARVVDGRRPRLASASQPAFSRAAFARPDQSVTKR